MAAPVWKKVAQQRRQRRVKQRRKKKKWLNFSICVYRMESGTKAARCMHEKVVFCVRVSRHGKGVRRMRGPETQAVTHTLTMACERASARECVLRRVASRCRTPTLPCLRWIATSLRNLCVARKLRSAKKNADTRKKENRNVQISHGR